MRYRYSQIIHVPVEHEFTVHVYSTINASGSIRWQQNGLAIDRHWQFGTVGGLEVEPAMTGAEVEG